MRIKKKNIIIGLVLLILLGLVGTLVYANIAKVNKADDGFVVALANEAGYYDITADELKTRIDDASDDNFIIVDVRDDASYEEAHIPRAINIPLNELGYRVFSLDKTKDIIVYCFTGVTSQVACQILINAGFKDVYNMTGGIKAWDYAIETSDGRVNI
ncbi:rhodanese-like domain-containing protein [Planctomycetota bacterium]